MRKLNSLFKSLFLLCALIVGSSAWADTATITFASQTSGTSDGSSALTASNFVTDGIASSATAFGTITCSATAKCYKGKTGYGLKVGASGNAGSFTISFSSPLSNVSKITLNRASYSETKAATITVKNGTTTLANAVSTPSGNADFSDMDIDGLSIASLAGITVETNKYCYIKSIIITYNTSGTPTCATPTFTPNSGTVISGTAVEINSATDGATIYYTMGENPANPTTSDTQYNPSNKPIVTTSTTIKAIAVKAGSNNSPVATATYTALSVVHAGTEADPYSVADARNAIEANTGVSEVYATGTVSQIVTAYSSEYGNITFNISTDGLTTSSQLQAYRCKGTTGVDASEIRVGDVVVIKGNLKKHNSTYEFDSNCELVSMQHATYPIINANDVTLEFDATSGEIAYTIDNPTSALLGATITSGDWISNIGYVDSKVTFSATQNTGAERTATIMLSYMGATNKVVTITQKEVGYATLPFNFDGNKGDIETTFGLTYKGLGSNYSSSPKLKFDDTGDYLILRTNASIGTLAFDIKGGSFSSGSTSTFKVQTSVNGTDYTDLATYTELEETETKMFDLDPNVRYVKWLYVEKGATDGGNVGIGNITTETVNATITAADYATFVSTRNVSFAGTGVTAYTAKVNDNSVKLTEVKKVLANTPVVIYKDVDSETTLTLPVSATAPTVAEGKNDLFVSDGSATGDNIYVLADKNDVVGFYKWAGGALSSGKIYLVVPAGSREFLGFFDATGIKTAESVTERGVVYDLQGRRVAQPTRGLYIEKGKKVIIK